MLIRRLSRIILILLLMSAAFIVGRQSSQSALRQQTAYGLDLSAISQESSDLNSNALLQEVYQKLTEKYLRSNDIDQEKLVYGAISGMVDAVGDPYTSFFDPKEFAVVNEELSQTYEGVGAVVGFRNDKLVIVAPLKDGPAELAGLKRGDELVEVDHKDVTNLSVPEVVNLLRGEAGTTIVLTIKRDGQKSPLEISIERQKIELDTVVWEEQSNVPVIQIYRFAKKTNQEWDQVVDEILQNGKPKTVVIDLRDNPGGYIDAAKHIASEFMTKDEVILKEQLKSGKSIPTLSDRDGKLQDVNVIVLINSGSASSSEILAGALREQVSATLVGEQSFGKGTVQESIPLSDNTGLHVTIAEWLLPSDSSVTDVGLTPDVKVSTSTDSQKDAQLQKALELSQK